VEYLWLKALHVAAALTWVGGEFAVALALAGLPTPRGEAESRRLRALRLWDRTVTTPAMLLLWGFGITLGMEGDWFHSPWLMAKLTIALALGALHGALSGTLRRAAVDPLRSVGSWPRHAAPAIVIGVTAIAILVVVKPFCALFPAELIRLRAQPLDKRASRAIPAVHTVRASEAALAIRTIRAIQHAAALRLIAVHAPRALEAIPAVFAVDAVLAPRAS